MINFVLSFYTKTMIQPLKMTDFLSDLADFFTGDYSYKRSSDVNDMRKDIMDISHIPTAFDDKEKIGEGTHQRYIIDLAKFLQKAAEKQAEK